MKTCPHCGGDLSGAKRLVASSARELVENLSLDSHMLGWLLKADPDQLLVWQEELDAFKNRLRGNGYRTNSGPVKDAHAAFYFYMHNAIKYAKKRDAKKPAAPPRPAPMRKDR